MGMHLREKGERKEIGAKGGTTKGKGRSHMTKGNIQIEREKREVGHMKEEIGIHILNKIEIDLEIEVEEIEEGNTIEIDKGKKKRIKENHLKKTLIENRERKDKQELLN